MYPEHLRNGGAYRNSHHIRRHPAVNVHHATRYSEAIGTPLNTFITINFTLLGCEPEAAVATFRKMLAERYAPWLRRTAKSVEALSPTYVWAMEAGGGHLACHWLVHVPVTLRGTLEIKLNSWLASLSADGSGQGVVDVRPIYNLIGARRYVLKGTEPVWAQHLGVRAVSQGVVIGKRSGFSRNLGPAARKRGGYKPKRNTIPVG